MEAAQNRLNQMIAELQAKQNKGYMGTAHLLGMYPFLEK